jgi:hypothetical protein
LGLDEDVFKLLQLGLWLVQFNPLDKEGKLSLTSTTSSALQLQIKKNKVDTEYMRD